MDCAQREDLDLPPCLIVCPTMVMTVSHYCIYVAAFGKRQIAYKGGSVNLDGSSAAGLFNCSKCAAIRASCTAKSGPKANCPGLERTCGGRQYVPPCCSYPKIRNCDGTVLPNIDKDRGKDYMHSSFIDIVISGLVGIRGTPTAATNSGASEGTSMFGEFLDLSPLADASIDYFAL
eukprot:SAG31_NODE_18367_length_639_cov_0.659259_1_plen_175_part_01